MRCRRISKRTEAVGMNAHITKPIQPQVLLETLAQWITPKIVHHSSTSPIPTIEGLNCEEAVARVNGNLDLYHKLLKQFAEEQGETFTEVQSLWQHQKFAEAADRVHTFAGLVGNLGGTELFSLAQQLEVGLRGENPESEKERIAECLVQAQQLSSAISAFVTSDVALGPKEATSLQPSITNKGDSSFMAALDEIAELLKEGNSRATSTVSELIANSPDDYKTKLQALLIAAEEFEFEQALKELEQLRTRVHS